MYAIRSYYVLKTIGRKQALASVSLSVGVALLVSGIVRILLVEQNAHKALGIASRGYVLENGTITTSGSSISYNFV